jgi:hypothetical protein
VKLFAADKVSNLASANWITLATAHATTAITGTSNIACGDYAPTAIGSTINAQANSLRFGAFIQPAVYITTVSDLGVGYASLSMEMST